MFSALKEVMEAKNNRLAHLREVILGNIPSQYKEIADTHFFWLNRSQEKAVNRVICAKEIAIVHGPPGTGKTTTLVEAIYETLRRENQVLCMCSKQHGSRLDIRKIIGPGSKCHAYRESDTGKRKDAFLHL